MSQGTQADEKQVFGEELALMGRVIAAGRKCGADEGLYVHLAENGAW